MTFQRFAFGLSLIVSGAFAGFIGGIKAAPRLQGIAEPAPSGPLSCNPEDAPVSKKRRNAVWRMLNDQPCAAGTAPEACSGDETIGLVLGQMLSPKKGVASRFEGFSNYLNKHAAYVGDQDEADRIRETVAECDAPRMLATLKRVQAADTKANRLIQSVLNDEVRLKLFLEGQPIPLE